MATNKIAIRRDTAANWTAANPTLVAGEFGFETDTRRMKLGDGATAWASLAYASYGLNSSGNIAMPTGKGIDFSAVTGGTGTASSNILDDYEEGTWTPTIESSDGGETVATTVTAAVYTKIGRAVTLSARITVDSVTGGSGRISVKSLPFPPVGAGLGKFCLIDKPATLTTGDFFAGVSLPDEVAIYRTDTTVIASADNSWNRLQATSIIQFSITYFA